MLCSGQLCKCNFGDLLQMGGKAAVSVVHAEAACLCSRAVGKGFASDGRKSSCLSSACRKHVSVQLCSWNVGASDPFARELKTQTNYSMIRIVESKDN